MICLPNQLYICQPLLAHIDIQQGFPLTSVLNAMFRQNTMAPVADTSNDLYTARSIRGSRVKLVIGLICTFSTHVSTMETLPKPATDVMP